MTPEKVKALAENVNNLLQLHDKQAQTTVKLFKICLEYLDDSKWPKYTMYGEGFEAAKAAGIRRRERKQQLIAALNSYIKMVSDYELWYYRTSQASSLEQAVKEGAVRKHTLDGPAKSLLDGCAADAVALIAQATDMMEHEAKIEYNLVVNGIVIEKKVRPS